MKRLLFILFLFFYSFALFSQKADIEQFRGSFKELISKAKQDNKKILIVLDREYKTPNDTLNSADKEFTKAHFYEQNLPLIYKLNSFWGEAVNIWSLYKWSYNDIAIYTDSNGNLLEKADISNYSPNSDLKFEIHYKTPKANIQPQLALLNEIRVNNESLKSFEQAYSENKNLVSIKNLLNAKNYLRIKDCELAGEYFNLLSETERLTDENFIIFLRNFCSIDTKIGNFLLQNAEKVKNKDIGYIIFWKQELIEKAAQINDISMAQKASNDHARLTNLNDEYTGNLKFWDMCNFYIQSKNDDGLGEISSEFAKKNIKKIPRNYKEDFRDEAPEQILNLTSIIRTILINSNNESSLKEAIKWSFFVEKHSKRYSIYISAIRAKLYYKIGETDKAIKIYEKIIRSVEDKAFFEFFLEKMKRGEKITFTEYD